MVMLVVVGLVVVARLRQEHIPRIQPRPHLMSHTRRELPIVQRARSPTPHPTTTTPIVHIVRVLGVGGGLACFGLAAAPGFVGR